MIDGVNDMNRAIAQPDRRSGNQRPHRPIRDGIPHADLRAGTHRHLERAGIHLGNVWPEGQGARHLRLQLPDGPPPRRARRALHPDLPPRLGHPRRPAEPHENPLRGHRPADRRAHRGPQAARPAGRHARRLGRRVRPHRLLAGRPVRRPTTAATTTRAASRCGWPAAA